MLTLRKNEKLQVLLSGAAATTELPIVVEFDEAPNDRHRSQLSTADGITTGGTAVDIVTGLASGRKIKSFSMPNVDTAAATATVRFYNKSGTTRIICTFVLAVGDVLMYNEARGWYVSASTGSQKTTTGTDNSTSLSTAVSAGLAGSTAQSAGVSAGLAGSNATSSATSAGLADSLSRSAATSAGLVNSTQTSTITSGTI